MLPVAIRSIIDQTFSDWELIIVDDGSTDNTAEIINQFRDERIKYSYQDNQERCVARNNGIDKSLGKYICFLDSDDYYLPERLTLLYKEIKARKEPVAMFYTGICFQKSHQIIRKTELLRDKFQNDFDFIVKSTIFCQQSCLKSEILKKHKFNPQFRIGEDMELWLRIVNEYHLIFLPDQFTIVIIDHEERSVNEKKFNPGKDQLNILKFIFQKDHPGYKVSKSLKKERISDTYFSISRHYIYNKNAGKAIVNLVKSIIKCSIHRQTKHKLFLIYNLLLKRKISEYVND